MVKEGDLLWTPSPEWVTQSNLVHFMKWLRQHRGLDFSNYPDLWRWSVTDIEAFWGALWEYCEVQASVPYQKVLGRSEMPGADWFPGARLNYAQNILRSERPATTALFYFNERTALNSMSWEELGGSVRILATQLRRLGVAPGDRVAAYLPNSPHAIIAMLATTSIGAIWTSCGPDFGTRGVLDRFAQLAPKVLFCVDGYQYAGKSFNRRPELTQIVAGLDSLELIGVVDEFDRRLRREQF